MTAISKGPILVKITLEEQCFIGLSFDLNIGSRSLHIIYPTSNYAWIIRQMQETRGEKTRVCHDLENWEEKTQCKFTSHHFSSGSL